MGRHRTAPGHLNLTPPRARILTALLAADGYVQALPLALSIEVPYGTVYGFLRQLDRLGWVEIMTERCRGEGKPARNLYTLTATGRDRATERLKEA